jgi:hypothetical protein
MFVKNLQTIMDALQYFFMRLEMYEMHFAIIWKHISLRLILIVSIYFVRLPGVVLQDICLYKFYMDFLFPFNVLYS